MNTIIQHNSCWNIRLNSHFYQAVFPSYKITKIETENIAQFTNLSHCGFDVNVLWIEPWRSVVRLRDVFSVSTSRSRDGLETCFETSRFRLGLAQICKVSASSRSRTARSRSHVEKNVVVIFKHEREIYVLFKYHGCLGWAHTDQWRANSIPYLSAYYIQCAGDQRNARFKYTAVPTV